MERILPDASGKGIVEQLGTCIPAKGEKIATVGMFRGCLMDVLFTETNIKTVKLLSEAGFEVVIPESRIAVGHSMHIVVKAIKRSNWPKIIFELSKRRESIILSPMQVAVEPFWWSMIICCMRSRNGRKPQLGLRSE